MRTRLVALGCSFASALGLLALGSLALAPAAGAATLPKPGMSVTTSAGSYAYGTKVRVTVTLNAKAPGATVILNAFPAGRKKTLVATGKVNRNKFYATYTVTGLTNFAASFNGDGRDAAASASRKVTVAAKVADAVTGYHKTTTIGGVSYRVYHGTATLTLKATVTPNKKGECLQPETEQYDAGTGWDADTRYGCDKLDRQSHDAAPFKLSQAVGDRYRIRADYTRAGRDTANLSADGAWVYFDVVK
jgi:hypothetical protein